MDYKVIGENVKWLKSQCDDLSVYSREVLATWLKCGKSRTAVSAGPGGFSQYVLWRKK